MTTDAVASVPHSQRLKQATQATHGVLDKRIMAGDIFASRENFARFLQVQCRFHRDVDGLYSHPLLQSLLPDLAGRRRLQKVEQDLRDLGRAVPDAHRQRLGPDTPLPVGLGWLYAAEGSNVGGSILYKQAQQKLGLNGEFGARHLAAHPDGVAQHWREFTAALDAVELDEAQEAAMIEAADQAFRTVHGYVDEVFA